MSTFRTIKANGKDYNFICRSRSNRSGFVHECELQLDGYTLTESKAQYYNRTWECYQYESVMGSCVYQLKEERKAEVKAELLEANGWGRICGDVRKAELEKALANDIKLKELENLATEVRHGHENYNFW